MGPVVRMATSPCRFCRHPNPSGAKFCNECGAQLTLQPCSHCDAVNDAGAEQCHQCGAALDAPLPGVRTDVPREHQMGSLDARDANADVSGFSHDARVTAHVPESLAESLERIQAELREVELAKSAGTGRADGVLATPEGRDATLSRPSHASVSMEDSPARTLGDALGDHAPRTPVAAIERDEAASTDLSEDLPLHEDLRTLRESLRQQRKPASRSAGLLAAAAFIAVGAVAYYGYVERGQEGAHLRAAQRAIQTHREQRNV